MPAGAPLGNKNAVKNRPITDLIRRAIAQNDFAKAREIADTLIAVATSGEKDSDRVNAFKEIADRIEGKVPQSLTGPDGGPLQVQDVPWLAGRRVARR